MIPVGFAANCNNMLIHILSTPTVSLRMPRRPTMPEYVRFDSLKKYLETMEKARKLDHIAILIDNFPGRPKYLQIMEAINLLKEIERIVKEAT
jgi:hypothetical protein